MADAIIAAATVGHGANAILKSTISAGETIDPGESVYLKSSDGKYWLADNATSADTATVIGMAMTAAAADQKITVLTSGEFIDTSAPFVEGKVYELSSTAGKIAPAGDAGSGDYLSILGGATSTTTLNLSINNTGGQVA